MPKKGSGIQWTATITTVRGRKIKLGPGRCRYPDQIFDVAKREVINQLEAHSIRFASIVMRIKH